MFFLVPYLCILPVKPSPRSLFTPHIAGPHVSPPCIILISSPLALTIIYVYVLLNLSCSKQLVCLFYLKNYFHFFLLMCGVSVHMHAGVFRGQKMAPDALSWSYRMLWAARRGCWELSPVHFQSSAHFSPRSHLSNPDVACFDHGHIPIPTSVLGTWTSCKYSLRSWRNEFWVLVTFWLRKGSFRTLHLPIRVLCSPDFTQNLLRAIQR